eukprot:2699670-Karenia_brevis.AAC.1
MVQHSPKMAQHSSRWPNIAPRWHYIAPRWLNIAPRWPNIALSSSSSSSLHVDVGGPTPQCHVDVTLRGHPTST